MDRIFESFNFPSQQSYLRYIDRSIRNSHDPNKSIRDCLLFFFVDHSALTSVPHHFFAIKFRNVCR